GGRRGLADDRASSRGVILIGPDGEKSEQQSVDDAEILQIHGEGGVEARLRRQQLPNERVQNQDAKPENEHEARAEQHDREQRGNVVDSGEQKALPRLPGSTLRESSV